MKVISREIPDLQQIPLALATGTFDGVHLGHCKIFEQLFKTGKSLGLQTAIVTFSPHPREVISGQPQALLTLDAEKTALISHLPYAPDYLVFYTFSTQTAAMSGRDFMDEVLMGKLNMKTFVGGYDHHLGNSRDSGPEDIALLAGKMGFDYVKVPAEKSGAQIYSSSAIRAAMQSGNIAGANQMLGYPYLLSGKVVRGNAVGATLGFPTANISVSPQKILPLRGVYACEVRLNNHLFKGMLNIGLRPTLGTDKQEVVEVHIFDFSGNLYDQEIQIRLHHRLRDEKRFASLQELSSQLSKDRSRCLELLS
jgi:riboflavin kinase/FMN adenylyltransferase